MFSAAGRVGVADQQHYQCCSPYVYTCGPSDLAGGQSCRAFCVTMRGALMFEFAGARAILGGLDAMERSPNLPLHFADENLEPTQRTIAARSTTEGPAGNQPDPMKQGSPKELRRNRR
jgi:hypothetical protein